jgi:hypothetical protein
MPQKMNLPLSASFFEALCLCADERSQSEAAKKGAADWDGKFGCQ